ncbi:SPOR domain-containing protein [Shinella sp. NM-101]|uniref:SPOR domain-containing protein n=1 Tax=Shinella sp. NM-101 TaxID=2744455 RepID=UPI001F43A37E|nr:SPOR domain-containing protein [Shinella sp. NM-101]
MADKNFARSGTADRGLLAEDDPLSELARLVSLEPRPVQDIDRSFSDAVQAAPRHENPVFALEDELLRAFEQYDAPAPAVDPVVAQPAAARHVEPVFEEPAPVEEDRASFIDEIPTRGVAPGGPVHQEPSFHEAVEPAFAGQSFVEPGPQADPALLLADELETSVSDVPPVDAGPDLHAGHLFAYRFEPRFEEPARHEPVAEPRFEEAPHVEEQPVFLGLQPLSGDDAAAGDIGLDLEHELELSIGDGFADERVADGRPDDGAEAAFVAPVPVAVEAVATNIEPSFDGWMPVDSGVEHAEPFHAEPAYAGEEPQFVAQMPLETREDRARAAARIEAQWQAEATEPVFDAEPAYQVESVETGGNYDRDALLAEVERFPVPEPRSPLSAETAAAAAAVVAAAAARSNTPANISAIFGRATPTAHREPVVEKAATPFVEPAAAPVQPIEPPVVEARREPVATPAPAVSEPELDFESLEFDLSDIDLDLSDFSLDDEPVKQEARPVEVKPEVAPPVAAETPVRREPAVAIPVSTYTRPQPVAAEANDGVLPFDPAMIADTDEGVSPVTELDVPHLPLVEKEKPPAYQPDYDLDIDAEMAQLFTEPAARPRNEDLQRGAAASAATAAAQPVTQINDVDDFERALEEDFRRSLNQPERMAIPVDPGQATTLYSGDGYDDETARPRRGMLIAASVAGLLLIGGGAVYAWSAFTGGSVGGSGEPRVILADKEPIKIVPEEKGGKTVPNQDKAVYDRVAGDTTSRPQQEQLVTSTEEPVDVVQRTLTPETLPFDGPEDGPDLAASEEDNRLLPGVDEPETAAAAAAASDKPVVSPRKVKTMIVKPDGTLVAREDTVTETAQLDAKATATTGGASGEAAATANAALDADASLRAEQTAAEAKPRSALAEVAETQVDGTAPVRTVKTTTIGSAATATAGDNAPVPAARPADQPVNVVGTVTENGRVSATETASATQVPQASAEQAQVAPGGYVIQIASLPSEAEAQKTYNSLSSKFGNVIGGRGVDIKKAEIPNKGTFFRVRIPAGSREEANTLCSRYKSAGGSCLVTR